MSDMTLLYVEDNKDSQEQLKMILQDDVKEFYQAFDGEEGLSMYKELKPDIILSDINMPILDGLSMVQKIKEIDEHQKVILISAIDDKESLLKALNIGVDFFTTKPIDIDDIYEQLHTIGKSLTEHTVNKN